jgi:hypothetical protein
VYELFGWTSFDSSISGNTLKAYVFSKLIECEFEFQFELVGSQNSQQSGTHSVRFANGQTVTFSLPQISLSGLLFGDRTFEYLGQMVFIDVANRIECTIRFNFEERGFFSSLFGAKPSHASDCFKGDILQRGKQVFYSFCPLPFSLLFWFADFIDNITGVDRGRFVADARAIRRENVLRIPSRRPVCNYSRR